MHEFLLELESIGLIIISSIWTNFLSRSKKLVRELLLQSTSFNTIHVERTNFKRDYQATGIRQRIQRNHEINLYPITGIFANIKFKGNARCFCQRYMPRIDQLSINGATHDQINRQRSYRHRERIRSFTVHSAVTRLERTRNAFTSSIPLFSPLSFFRIRRIMKILKLPAAKLTLSENSGQSLLRFLDRSRREVDSRVLHLGVSDNRYI